MASYRNKGTMKPEYAKDSILFRIVARTNGTWRAEMRVAERGANTHDCWSAIGGWVTKAEAQNQRDTFARRGGPARPWVKASADD